ncbi:tetratricopeptide repeat protein [Lacinutrix mariniflava]|uniref:tetratricopeptide repeat protein n=1 Tax=Lacinutrix mariniflava TaxID=342955 RepID=UPI0009FAAA5C|nr:tetratricopeptide repeat protein [Lacinutrix mariniflava]
MKSILQLFLIICMASQSFAQNPVSQEKEIINGIVLDEDGNPFPGVTVNIQGTENGAQTNLYGNYSINVSIGETLTFSFSGYKSEELKILNSNPINLSLKISNLIQEQVVTTAMGIETKRNEITYAYKEIDNKLLNQGNNFNAINALEGKVSGLIVDRKKNTISLRGARSMRGNNNALIVIDGSISTYGLLESLDPNSIKSINVLKGQGGAVLYGSQGSNGVVVVTTQRYRNTAVNTTFKKSITKPVAYKGRLKVVTKKSKPAYLKALEDESSVEKAFELFNTQKEKYKDFSSYYIDVYSFFNETGNKSIGKEVLNDVVFSKMDDYQTLKGLAMKLQVDKDYDLANSIYKRLLILRPNDAQSFIDLAQAYIDSGKKQKAFDLLTNLLELTKDTSKINGIVKNEINGMLQTMEDIDDSKLEAYNKLNTTFDLRVLASWNREINTISMQVIDPSLEVVSRNNSSTRLGGELVSVNDVFGPEEYTIRNAAKGDYYIGFEYEGDSNLKDAAAFVKLIIYKNFGKLNQTKEVKVIKLNNPKDKNIVAKISM